MTGGHDPGADGGPDQRALQSGRSWQHPSEVGLATRGRADRRRSTVIAGGVVLGGVGLLLSGVLMGTMQQSASATTSTLPAQRANQSITLVTADVGGPTATGLILDDEGHVLVDGRAVGGAGEVWVRCADGEMEQASVMARDASTDLAVLQLDRPHGVPASFATGTPDPGERLQLVTAGEVSDTSVSLTARAAPAGRVGELIDLTRTRSPRSYLASVDDDPPPSQASLAGGMVFDRSGRLAGVVTGVPAGATESTVRVLSADDAVEVAEELLAEQR